MNFGLNLWKKVFCRMFVLSVILFRTPSGHSWIINKVVVEQRIWLWNHISCTKVTSMNLLQMSCVITYAYVVVFDLRGHEGCRTPKRPIRGQKRHEGVDMLKKWLNKRFSATSKTQRLTKTSRRPVFIQVGLWFFASKKLAHLSGYFAFKHHRGWSTAKNTHEIL